MYLNNANSTIPIAFHAFMYIGEMGIIQIGIKSILSNYSFFVIKRFIIFYVLFNYLVVKILSIMNMKCN